ncbi:MAG: UDP-N-acetylmuramoyl-tripeptide--D-alanyl-D-alanine ligase [Phycisphaerae bacterium]|nr:UDP-N-acetylmuramoyl-tripeptide--D-alanyl-D-alanine ligase [Phycisphaerae bacterium]MDD5380161.1 UDP-N-acetylmuramoyl-tripeptide--D-alanyl-D-alanine ligase [Phycisphaerae bacterium]
MKKFLIKDLAQIIKSQPLEDSGRALRAVSHGSFIRVNTDSRTIKTGDCFFAISGDNFDGHDYIDDAFAKGAVCAVVSRDIDSPGFCLLKVDDTIKALGDFAAEFRRLMNFKVVAVTGSVGKTTVRQIVHHILSQNHRVFQSQKNFNNQIGLPLTLLGADPKHEIVVTELGTNHPGEIAYLTAIAQPNIAVVTNVYPAHLEGFGSVDAIAKEKLSISQGLPSDGVLIINSAVTPPAELSAKILTFGKIGNCDFRAQNISFDGPASRFTIDGAEVLLPLAGPGNVENALAAWAVCSQFGITIDDFAQAVKTLSTVPMRAEFLQIGTLTVLNDCYNANPASMKNALDILAGLVSKEKRRAVFICGDMAELGRQTEDLHTGLGNDIAGAEVQLLLTVGDSAKIAADSAKNAAKYGLQTNSFADVLSACNNLKKFIKDYDIILVKGSRINRLEVAVEKLKELFS